MKRLSWIIAIAVLLLPAALALACPLCKESIPNTDAENPDLVPVGINNSIYYMLGGLFVTMGLLATVITKGIRSTDARMDERRVMRDE